MISLWRQILVEKFDQILWSMRRCCDVKNWSKIAVNIWRCRNVAETSKVAENFEPMPFNRRRQFVEVFDKISKNCNVRVSSMILTTMRRSCDVKNCSLQCHSDVDNGSKIATKVLANFRYCSDCENWSNIGQKFSINFRRNCDVLATSEISWNFGSEFWCLCDVKNRSKLTGNIWCCSYVLVTSKIDWKFWPTLTYFWHHCNVEKWSRIGWNLRPKFEFSAT